MKSRLAAILPPLAVLTVAIGTWYLASNVLISEDRRFLLPSPDAVVRVAFLDPANLNELLAGLALSAQVAMVGLGFAIVLGLALAILMSQAPWLERSLFPYAVVLQTIPILALVPLFG